MKNIVEQNGHPIDVDNFRNRLINWGKSNFRHFPWRMTQNPYHILISEVMLHRTQANQVVPVYKDFISKFPDIPTLSKASEKEMHEILYSLGLRWRIDLLHQMTEELLTNFGGKVPEEREALLSLPGVSDYIASAVRCFVWNLPERLADTNTVRIVGRLFGLEIRDASRRNRIFKNLLDKLVSHEQPRGYNYALLDLADKICTKRREPDCGNCPLQSMCHHGKFKAH